MALHRGVRIRLLDTKLFLVDIQSASCTRSFSSMLDTKSSSSDSWKSWTAGYTRHLHATSSSLKLASGLVGLPNVGKSTLFNAIVASAGKAAVGNYPFTTIEKNVGISTIHDQRLLDLAKLNASKSVKSAALEFVDIAGLVKDASKGSGMGNSFLADIRECDAIVQVVRCFEDDDVIHVDGNVNPVRDIEVINLELIMADYNQVQRLMEKPIKQVKGAGHDVEAIRSGMKKIATVLEAGKLARSAKLEEDEFKAIKPYGFLTMKPMIYAANVKEDDIKAIMQTKSKSPCSHPMVSLVTQHAEQEGSKVVVVSAQVESEINEMDKEDQGAFLSDLGISETERGLNILCRATYELLDLVTYFTSGPTETRAWTIRRGTRAPQAAAEIHTDFERGFIRAETVHCDDLLRAGSEKGAREQGLIRSEGKDYVVKDGDVILFRFNV